MCRDVRGSIRWIAFAVALLTPAILKAAPIQYQLTFTADVVETTITPPVVTPFTDAPFKLEMSAKIADVENFGTNFVNTGPGGAGMTAFLTGAGLVNRQYPSGTLVVGVQQSQSSLILDPSDLSSEFVDMFNPAFATYDMKSSLGPVSDTFPGGPLIALPSPFDFGTDGLLTFGSIDDIAFQATATSSDDITYQFTWNASGTFTFGESTQTTRTNAVQFKINIQGDTADVGTFGSNVVNDALGAGLLATISGGGLVDRPYPLGPLVVGVQQNQSSVLIAPISGNEFFEMVDPAFTTYDLRTSLGPVQGVPDLFDLPDPLDFGGGEKLALRNLRDVSFTAITAAVPEPATAFLISLGMFGLGWSRRRK